MCGEKVEIFASGRMDAGVHADEQTANFKCDTLMGEVEILNYINKDLRKNQSKSRRNIPGIRT